MAAEARNRILEAGCRAWQVNADEVEEAIRDLIAAERGTPDFMDRVDAMLRDRVQLEDTLQRRVTMARDHVLQIESEQRRTVQAMAKAQDSGISDELFLDNLKRLQLQHADALRRLEDAVASQQAVETHRSDLRQLFDETRAILDRWDNGSVADRQAIMAWWVDLAMIQFETVERTPKNQRQRASKGLGQRSARRKLIVFLSTVAKGGLELELGPPKWKQKQIGTRTWAQIDVKTMLPAQSSEESGTLKSPTDLAEPCHNDGRKTTRSADCTR